VFPFNFSFLSPRAPIELFNFHHILTTWEWDLIKQEHFLPLKESYKAVMKWAIFAPALVNPLVYFMFSPEARHGISILFERMCSCCCNNSSSGELKDTLIFRPMQVRSIPVRSMQVRLRAGSLNASSPKGWFAQTMIG